MFNRMKLVKDDTWVCYWLLEDGSIVYQDNEHNTHSSKFDSYHAAAWRFIQYVIEAQMLGFKHVPC